MLRFLAVSLDRPCAHRAGRRPLSNSPTSWLFQNPNTSSFKKSTPAVDCWAVASPALIASLVLAYSEKNLLALGAAALILTNLVIFYFFTYPVRVATQNWTVMPDNWEALRRHWECSHLLNAGVTFSAFCLAILAALK